ncbi:hypothetical protein R3P38DRAFT_2828617 [Favolaschia claudopus]|uniref:Uncharacterized protein n=1 Tax=Favolaschia claudopus TaxID=2862362 RepID=A0AAW0EAG5_9AGAR
MQCIFPTTASNAFRVFSARTTTFPSTRVGLITRVARGSPQRFRATARVLVTSAALSNSHVSLDTSPSVQEELNVSHSLPNLERPSKISFAAATAIRLCVKNGGIADGFFVLNSIRYAAHRQRNSSLPFKMPGMLYSKIEFEAAALQFGPDVSPRLSAHTLLHGLIRNKLAEPAFELAKLMMAEGLVIRSASMQAVLESLVSSDTPRRYVSRGIPFAPPSPTIPLGRAADVLHLRPSIMPDRRTRFALQLLFLARRHRQRRTDAMFKLFLAATLLHGELIIFSLLFGWTCRDWQTSYSLQANLEGLLDDEDSQSSCQVVIARKRLAHLRSEAIFPDQQSLESGLTIIDTILTRDGQQPRPTHDRLVALQALGNLAGLLDRKQIPFSELATLISLMYKCPRVDDEIWIVGDGGCPERIKAHDYFHQVLLNLLQTLPRRPPSRPPIRARSIIPNALTENHRYPMLPPLELSGYNALLHYALRQRLSPALAETVLVHMAKKRWKPVHADIVTANILLRSGTLMRRYDIVSEVLEKSNLTYVLAVPPRDIPNSTDPPPPTHIPLPPVSAAQNRTEVVVNRTRLGKVLGRIADEEMHIPELPSKADVYSLTTYIAYLTSRGRPHKVTKLLFGLFPELDTDKYPTNSERRSDKPRGRRALLTTYRRAIALGPVFFSAVLNALYKSGQPALADRVWHLAMKAEQHSWERQLLPKCKPWILEVHAYTVMLNCYGDLAARRTPWRLTLPPQRINHRTAVSSAWANFLYECQKLPTPLPADSVLELLRRVMNYAAFGVFRRLIHFRRQYAETAEFKSWFADKDIPKPDARFFNAALRAFRPRMPAMRKSWHRRQWRDARFELEYKGVLPANAGWNRQLHEVAETMVHSGYAVPHGLRPMFVGRSNGVDLRIGISHRPSRGPFVVPPRKVHPWRRYRLHTPKERGLPLSRTYSAFRQNRHRRRYVQKLVKVES